MYDFLIELISNLNYLSQENKLNNNYEKNYFEYIVKEKKENYANELYLKGITYKKNNEVSKAYEYLFESYEYGNLKSVYDLAELLFDDESGYYDSNTAIKLCEEGIDNGNYKCAYLLGVAYDCGNGVSINKELAEENYRICINRSGDSKLINNSKYKLANILWEKSHKNEAGIALKLYEEIINIGDYKAIFELGYKYYLGEKVEKNYELAMLYFRISAKYNYYKAQHYIGFMYDEGKGIPCSYKSAIYWYKLAASNGSVSAINNLGVMYQNGNGVSRDRTKAFELYRKAYDASDNKSSEGCIMYNIGLCYKYGRGTKKDLEQAKYWLSRSVKAGYKDAELSLKNID